LPQKAPRLSGVIRAISSRTQVELHSADRSSGMSPNFLITMAAPELAGRGRRFCRYSRWYQRFFM